MLVIRATQMKLMEEVARCDFVRRLRQHLESIITAPAHWVLEQIVEAVESGRRLGITRECDVARYCELMILSFGSVSFDYVPKDARNILLAHGVDGAEKLRRMEEWKRAENA
jgi:hypothetical protein